MKILLALLTFGLALSASAEICTSVIKDRWNGYEYQSFTRQAYSKQAACDQALYDCQGELSWQQSRGQYQNAQCELQRDQYPPYPPTPDRGYICQTDLVDYYGRTIREFTAPGATEWDACRQSDQFCKVELARRDSHGTSCVTRGLINRRPPPPRTRTESCTADRRDPAGMYIQSYNATWTGNVNEDVRGIACREAMNQCYRDLRGRQTCNIR